MFYTVAMQDAFDFGAGTDIARIRVLLRARLGVLVPFGKLEPADQFVRSSIGSRTRDAVSWAAFGRLRCRFPRWTELATAKRADIEVAIAEVTYADVKAARLGAALRAILADHPDLDLGFLGRWPVDRALLWLERLPGAGPKVAAAVLNFSTLERPAFVVDTHVLRVLRRFGFVGRRADTRRACDAVMVATSGWSAADLTEMHVLLKRLGQTVCRAEVPDCRICPLKRGCRTANRYPPRLETL